MFVVFDLETTGLSQYADDIIEFSYILFDSNNAMIKSEQLYFYYEGMSWSEEAYQVHKIPLDFLKQHADEFRENLVKMYSILNYAIVVGHNSTQFDAPFAQKWLQRMGIGPLRFRYVHDTMIEMRPLTQRSRIKLSKLATMCGITDDLAKMMLNTFFPNNMRAQYHDAAYDTTVTALIVLFAINEGYMVMEPRVVNEEVIRASMQDLENVRTTQVDPKRFIVFLCDDDDEDDARPYFVNHDYETYQVSTPTESDIEIFRQQHLVLPVTLFKTEEDSNEVTYEGSKGDLQLIFCRDNYNGDSLEIKSPYFTIQDNNTDMASMIKNNFEEA